MNPEIVSRPAFTVVGVKYRGNNPQADIPPLWEHQLMPRMGEIRSAVEPGVCYGVMGNYDPLTGEFDYLAGMEVSDASDIPDGFETWHVPAQTYAVFTTTLNDLVNTYEQLYSRWIPESGHETTDGPGFEYYGPDFCPTQKLSIFVAVKA